MHRKIRPIDQIVYVESLKRLVLHQHHCWPSFLGFRHSPVQSFKSIVAVEYDKQLIPSRRPCLSQRECVQKPPCQNLFGVGRPLRVVHLCLRPSQEYASMHATSVGHPLSLHKQHRLCKFLFFSPRKLIFMTHLDDLHLLLASSRSPPKTM